MPKKKNATNGKAKRERLETFDTGCLPPPCRTLTPERAKQWLAEEYDQWQHYANRVLTGGHGDTWLRDSIGFMVAACTAAIGSGKTVRLAAENLAHTKGDGMPSWFGVMYALEQVTAALRETLDDEWEFNDMHTALAAVLADLLRTAQIGDREQERLRVAARERRAAVPDPDEFKAIEAEREALEAERDEALIAVSKPWDEKIEALKAREIEIKRQVVKRFDPPSDAAGMLNHALLVSEIERHDEKRAEVRA